VAERRFHAVEPAALTGLEVGEGQARILLGDPVQAYCDLLEVRWLLSVQAGRDIGDEEALTALALRFVPLDAAASMAVADAGSDELLRLTPAVLAHPARIHDEEQRGRT
jgi:hypothetical protein